MSEAPLTEDPSTDDDDRDMASPLFWFFLVIATVLAIAVWLLG